MQLRPVVLAVAGALALHAPARADSLALEKVTLDPELGTVLAITPAAPASEAAASALACRDPDRSSYGTRVILESVRWHPRRWRDRGDRWESSHGRTSGYSQIHAGFLDPDGEQRPSFLAGFRGGLGVDEHIQLGLGLDWVHKSERNSVLVSSVPLPGGGTSERRLELARASSNLFPMSGYLQVQPGNVTGLMPFFGVGGGYNVLFLSADNFQTSEHFDATYGGWGWQAWGGVSVPLSGNSRITAEVFRNQSEVGRDVDDPQTGVTYREIVNLDGVGMRFGLGWGF